MGSQIAHVLLAAGAQVVLTEADSERSDEARARVVTSLEEAERRGYLAVPAEEIAARLHADNRFEALREADLVIEAVPEQFELKRQVLRRIEEQVAVETTIATNTSSLSVTELSASLSFPQRFIGMHFFNPVPASLLVELVRGERTSEATLDEAKAVVVALGKTAVSVRDTPGFATSRLGVLLGLEAIRMLEEDVASVEDIDAAMVLGYRFPIGPLKLTDLVGLDVRLDIAIHLAAALGPRFQPPELLRRKVANGELGKKTGHGFYTW